MSEKLKITLKAARINANIPMKVAAECIGKSVQTLALYESGKVDPKLKVVLKLCELYHVTIDDIFLT